LRTNNGNRVSQYFALRSDGWFYPARAIRALLVLAMLLACPLPQAMADAQDGKPVFTGDAALDASLQGINRRFHNKTRELIAVLSREYMLPRDSIDKLVSNQDFAPADVFLIVAVADLSGQPLATVSRVYLEHRAAGWAYVLEQLNIDVSSSDFEQLEEDAALYD